MKKISVFRTLSKKIVFQCTGIVALIGAIYFAVTYFIFGTFDIESMPDEGFFQKVGIFVVWSMVVLACVIRYIFVFFVLLDRRNFGTIDLSTSFQKSLEITKGKYIPIFFGWLLSVGIFFALNICLQEVLEEYIVLLSLWKILHLVCFNSISFIILTSIYNSLLQANGLIPLSQGEEVSQVSDGVQNTQDNTSSPVITEI